ncbi:MAG: peptidoglycan-binding domain-containing protein [Shinella sp.]|nr:peptidoglycan-binding domain-containing protein [Shinella sp.]
MTTRTRRAPDKRQPGQSRRGGRSAARAPRKPGIVLRGVVALARLAGRHPTVLGGCTAFAVIFSFVAANALWYQPGQHPSPILKTRNALNSLGFSATRPKPQDVTTFVIEREGEAGGEGGSAASPLVADIQRELARQGFYAGDPDGLPGDGTIAAIRAFQEKRGLPVTGEPDDEVLTALISSGPAVTDVLPAERPFEEARRPQPASTGEDPVAAAIRAAEADPGTTSAVRKAAPSEMVMKIQKGLSNIAYTDVTVDGVAGERTRTAIRHFEKHYRLPPTGEPNEMVLKKLKEIGAL